MPTVVDGEGLGKGFGGADGFLKDGKAAFDVGAGVV